jgi:hypothetical protein
MRSRDAHEIAKIDVEDGLSRPRRISRFFEWSHTSAGNQVGGCALCDRCYGKRSFKSSRRFHETSDLTHRYNHEEYKHAFLVAFEERILRLQIAREKKEEEEMTLKRFEAVRRCKTSISAYWTGNLAHVKSTMHDLMEGDATEEEVLVACTQHVSVVREAVLLRVLTQALDAERGFLVAQLCAPYLSTAGAF